MAEVTKWLVCEAINPITKEMRLRLMVSYASGQTRTMGSFADRDALNKYVLRFYPEILGKEIPA